MDIHPAPAGAVIYARDLARLSDFYLRTLGMRLLHAEPGHQVIESDDMQLHMYAIPAHIASTFSISSPPQVREEQAIKLFFTVPSIADAAAVAASLGGAVSGPQSPGPGFRMRNGYDPEGNVFQLRERVADAA
jgi:predicted enzyme related to lactoylglutathione lyase